MPSRSESDVSGLMKPVPVSLTEEDPPPAVPTTVAPLTGEAAFAPPPAAGAETASTPRPAVAPPDTLRGEPPRPLSAEAPPGTRVPPGSWPRERAVLAVRADAGFASCTVAGWSCVRPDGQSRQPTSGAASAPRPSVPATRPVAI